MMNTVKNMKFLGLGLLSSAVLLASCEKKKKETPAPPVVGKFAITEVQVMGGDMPFSYDAMMNRLNEMSVENHLTLLSTIDPIISLIFSGQLMEGVSNETRSEVASALSYLNNSLLFALNSSATDKYYTYLIKDIEDKVNLILANKDAIKQTTSVETVITPIFKGLAPLIVLAMSSGEEGLLKKQVHASSKFANLRLESPMSAQEAMDSDPFLLPSITDILDIFLADPDAQQGISEYLQFIQSILANLQLDFTKNNEIQILNAESGADFLAESNVKIKTEWVSSTEELKKFKIVYQFDAQNPNALIKVAVSLASMGSGAHQLTIDGVEWDWNTVLQALNTSIDNNTALDNPDFGTLNMRAYLKDMLLQIKQEDAQFKLLIANVLQLVNLSVELRELKN